MLIQFTPPEFDVGLLSSIAKVFDNPLSRAALGAVGLGPTVGASLSALAGNQAAVNAQIGAGAGSVYQGGSPVYTPTITGAPMMIGNNLFPSIPGVSTTGIGTAMGKAIRLGAGYGVANGLRKRRRMNPANIKAARRAIRRIRGTRRILQRIERMLPVRTVHSRRK